MHDLHPCLLQDLCVWNRVSTAFSHSLSGNDSVFLHDVGILPRSHMHTCTRELAVPQPCRVSMIPFLSQTLARRLPNVAVTTFGILSVKSSPMCTALEGLLPRQVNFSSTFYFVHTQRLLVQCMFFSCGSWCMCLCLFCADRKIIVTCIT